MESNSINGTSNLLHSKNGIAVNALQNGDEIIRPKSTGVSPKAASNLSLGKPSYDVPLTVDHGNTMQTSTPSSNKSQKSQKSNSSNTNNLRHPATTVSKAPLSRAPSPKPRGTMTTNNSTTRVATATATARPRSASASTTLRSTEQTKSIASKTVKNHSPQNSQHKVPSHIVRPRSATPPVPNRIAKKV